MLRISILALLAAALPAVQAPAFAADPCDTLVIPPGAGISGPSDVTALNFLLANSQMNQAVSGLLYAGLISMDKNDQIDYFHSIATKIESFDQGKRYVVTMRPWLWSDRQPVTADDVLFTWETIKKLGDNYVAAGEGGIPDLVDSVKQLNPEQFEVDLKSPANPLWFELNGLGQLTPLPRHAWKNLTTDQLYENQSDPKFFQVVDGPYKIESFVMGRSISFVPNPLYPLEHTPFKRMVFKFVNSDGAELQGIAAGELDLANLPHEAWQYGSSVPNSHLVPMQPPFGYDYIGLNFKNPKVPFFSDLTVRQAIQDSIDQKTMIAALWHGFGVAGYGPVPAVPPTYLSPEAKARQFRIGYDPAKAIALLEHDGYRPDPDGIRAKNGVRLEFTLIVPSGTSTTLMMAQMMQPDLRKSGILMHIQQQDFNQMWANLIRHLSSWEAFALEWSTSPFPSGETIFNTGGAFNFTGYSDPKMDQLIKDSTDKPGLDALYQYQDYATAQLPYIFLPETADDMLVHNGIGGVDRLITPAGGYNPQLLTLNREACHAAHAYHAR